MNSFERDGVTYYIVPLYEWEKAVLNRDLHNKMLAAEDAARALGYEVFSPDGNGMWTEAIIPSAEEAIKFKLTHL